MEDVIRVASYICQRYERQFGMRIDEMKLHILLYFIQRECLVQTGHTLFDTVFCAKSFGPYIPQVHAAYAADALHETLSQRALNRYASVFDNVFLSLAPKKSRSLSNIVHGEHSWKRAFANGENTPVSVRDIETDASRFRVRCFLLSNLNELRKPAYV